MHFFKRLSFFLAIMAAGCNEAPPPAAPPSLLPATSAHASEPLSSEQTAQLEAFALQARAWANGLNQCGGQLLEAANALLEAADDSALNHARQQWQTCQTHYSRIHALVPFSDKGQEHTQQLHLRLASTLSFPGFIDSVEGYPFSGIVNDASLELAEDTLIEQHGLTDIRDVSLGFDVIAFLLWGEHHYNSELAIATPTRFQPITHWEDSRTDLPISEHPNNRRRHLLMLVINVLQQDLQTLLAIWQAENPPVFQQQALEWHHQQEDTLQQNQAAFAGHSDDIEWLSPWLPGDLTPTNNH